MLRAISHRRAALSLAALILAAAAATLLVFLTGPHTYETPEFAFEYPNDWEELAGVEFPGAELRGNTEFADNTVGLDPDNWLTVVTEPVSEQVTADNVGEVVDTVRAGFPKSVDPAQVRILREAYEVRDAGLPGLRFRLALKSPRGLAVENEITTLYRGEMSYTISCQNRPDRATEMAAGCERVFDSFRAKALGR